MAEIVFRVSITQRLFSQRAHNQVMNRVHLETMNYIKTVYEQYHFELVAYARYHGVFVKRSAKWQRLKAREVHHQRPNEFSGALRVAVLADSVTRSTATTGTFAARAPLTSKIPSGRQKGKTIRRPLTAERRAELETVSPEEINEQCARQQAQYKASIYDPQYQSSVLKQFR